jgi:hypothetical protein
MLVLSWLMGCIGVFSDVVDENSTAVEVGEKGKTAG